jgi:hypothetical protein
MLQIKHATIGRYFAQFGARRITEQADNSGSLRPLPDAQHSEVNFRCASVSRVAIFGIRPYAHGIASSDLPLCASATPRLL